MIFSQLKSFDSLRPTTTRATKKRLATVSNNESEVLEPCVWEDDRLQQKLKELMELSFTSQQITDLVKWLDDRITECAPAIYVIADAISTAARKDETIDAVQRLLMDTTLKSETYLQLSNRYQPRFWNIATQSCKWVSRDSTLNNPTVSRLVIFLKAVMKAGPSEDLHPSSLTYPSAFRCLCAAWSVGLFGDDPDGAALLKTCASHEFAMLHSFILLLRQNSAVGIDEMRIIQYHSKAFARCICIDFPQVLE
jgi:hypothetical protein